MLLIYLWAALLAFGAVALTLFDVYVVVWSITLGTVGRRGGFDDSPFTRALISQDPGDTESHFEEAQLEAAGASSGASSVSVIASDLSHPGVGFQVRPAHRQCSMNAAFRHVRCPWTARSAFERWRRATSCPAEVGGRGPTQRPGARDTTRPRRRDRSDSPGRARARMVGRPGGGLPYRCSPWLAWRLVSSVPASISTPSSRSF